MNAATITEYAMSKATPMQAFAHDHREMVEKLRTIPHGIKKSQVPGFLKEKYLGRELQTCPSWARYNLCRYGSQCVKAHYYFPTIVWRAHRIGQKTSTCREWQEQQDIIEEREREAVDEEADRSIGCGEGTFTGPGSNTKTGQSRAKDLASLVPGCRLPDEICGYAHESEESETVKDRVDFIKKMKSLPYRAVAMLECKTCGAMFREVEDVLRHGRVSGHFEDSLSTSAKAEKYGKLAENWRTGNQDKEFPKLPSVKKST